LSEQWGWAMLGRGLKERKIGNWIGSKFCKLNTGRALSDLEAHYLRFWQKELV